MMRLYCDGASRGNGHGLCAWAYAVINDNGRIVQHDENWSRNLTNNVMEYTALIEGLKWCVKNKVVDLDVYQDSQLVNKQMLGEYEVGEMRDLYMKARILADTIGNVRFHWVPRTDEGVKMCDKACNLLMDKCV
jgi:ribonuclease HI